MNAYLRPLWIKQVDCPFIVCMTYAFHTPDKLCFILDLMNGGDLHYHLSQHGVFNESEMKFYAAEVSVILFHNSGLLNKQHNVCIAYQSGALCSVCISFFLVVFLCNIQFPTSFRIVVTYIHSSYSIFYILYTHFLRKKK